MNRTAKKPLPSVSEELLQSRTGEEYGRGGESEEREDEEVMLQKGVSRTNRDQSLKCCGIIMVGTVGFTRLHLKCAGSHSTVTGLLRACKALTRQFHRQHSFMRTREHAA